ncbi:MAG: hypothetical protein JJE55_13635 [Flavobacteriaceae bacterium]|nr:hypothetical protein [Flavobacteriaceae bacterium]
MKKREPISKITTENPTEKIIVMGNLNDDPSSESAKILAGTDLYNPMELLLTKL